MDLKRKVRNRAQCGACKDIIESHHRHDFVTCECGGIFVDGGHDYCRAGGLLLDQMIPMYEDENETDSE